MSPLSRLGKQIQEVLERLESNGVPSALIGGLALAPYKVIRATQDIDLLADAGRAEVIDRELQKLGYRCLHRSSDAGNYLRGDERVDFLYASRPVALRLLAEAKSRSTPFGTLRVISLEGLIAFKLQGLVNDPSRTRDLEDIRALLQVNRDIVNLEEVRECLTARYCWMKSSRKYPEQQQELTRPVVLFADGGVSVPLSSARDSFEALDDLMAVMDVLCPQWPARKSFGPMRDLRL